MIRAWGAGQARSAGNTTSQDAASTNARWELVEKDPSFLPLGRGSLWSTFHMLCQYASVGLNAHSGKLLSDASCYLSTLPCCTPPLPHWGLLGSPVTETIILNSCSRVLIQPEQEVNYSAFPSWCRSADLSILFYNATRYWVSVGNAWCFGRNPWPQCIGLHVRIWFAKCWSNFMPQSSSEGTVDSHNKKGPRGVEEENDEQEETNEGRIMAEGGSHSGRGWQLLPFRN